MQFAAAISRDKNTEIAAERLVESLKRQIPGPIHLLTVFLTDHHADEVGALVTRLQHDLSPQVLLGCTGESIIGVNTEIEREPGISVLAGRLPGVELSSFSISVEEFETMLDEQHPERLRRRVGATGDGTRVFIVFGEPHTTPIVELMHALDTLVPGAPTIGGMASGHAGRNVLLVDNEIIEDGAVGVRIGGPVRVDTIVSQGCRPIGSTLLVTRADGNMIATLGGRPALEVTREILSGLTAEEQNLVQNGLFLGIVINEYQPAFARGDFLVRGVLGADPNSGAVAVGDVVRAGQTVQFHVRDADTADEDLHLLMAKAAEDETAPTGALLFSCNGRGVRMFDMPNHDVRGVLEAVPETPIAGFFAAGELGPVGGRSFIHGHTASIALFRPIED